MSDADGAFEISRYLSEGRYQFVSFDGLPPGGYVYSTRQGGRDALTEGVTAPGEDITVLVRSDGGEIRGRVSDKSGAKVNRATVVLVPEEPLRSRMDTQNTHLVEASDQNGSFEFTGVIPGDYRLYAWTEIQPGAHTDPNFMKPFEESGRVVRVGPWAKIVVDVKLVESER